MSSVFLLEDTAIAPSEEIALRVGFDGYDGAILAYAATVLAGGEGIEIWTAPLNPKTNEAYEFATTIAIHDISIPAAGQAVLQTVNSKPLHACSLNILNTGSATQILNVIGLKAGVS